MSLCKRNLQNYVIRNHLLFSHIIKKNIFVYEELAPILGRIDLYFSLVRNFIIYYVSDKFAKL